MVDIFCGKTRLPRYAGREVDWTGRSLKWRELMNADYSQVELNKSLFSVEATENNEKRGGLHIPRIKLLVYIALVSWLFLNKRCIMKRTKLKTYSLWWKTKMHIFISFKISLGKTFRKIFFKYQWNSRLGLALLKFLKITGISSYNAICCRHP